MSVTTTTTTTTTTLTTAALLQYHIRYYYLLIRELLADYLIFALLSFPQVGSRECADTGSIQTNPHAGRAAEHDRARRGADVEGRRSVRQEGLTEGSH